ncbi:hypothetical protein FACS189499_06700 [Clostridia bacterium]|nr:hypothetical protein FACS189499_06700 [Clostridia bacterium]
MSVQEIMQKVSLFNVIGLACVALDELPGREELPWLLDENWDEITTAIDSLSVVYERMEKIVREIDENANIAP